MKLCSVSVQAMFATCPVFLAAWAAHAQRSEGIDAMWKNNCASCHGDAGQGGGAGTRTLLTDELMDPSLDTRFYEAIKKGVPDGGMPGYGETMSEAQLWSMVVATRERQARAHRQRVGSTSRKGGPITTKHHTFAIERVIDTDLDVPWSVDFLPDGRMLVAERPGRLRIHSTGKIGGTLSKDIGGVPAVRNRGQGGLMEVKVHPDYATTGWVYLAFSHASEEGARPPGMTKIVRGKIKTLGENDHLHWGDEEVIFEAKKEHYVKTDLHFGCRIVFDPPAGPVPAAKDGTARKRFMYFAIGERGLMDMAPDLTRPNGKIHRVFDDGTIPSDNPFVDTASAEKGIYPSIWTYGHRNPQGLVLDLSGRLWDTEHGPRGGDELNLIVAQGGADYGWPKVCFGINYNGAPFKTPWPRMDVEEQKGIVMPTYRWMPSIGACGLDVVQGGSAGEAFPKWKGDLLAGGLSGENVDRLRISDAGELVEREEIIHGLGRVRDVSVGPDGVVYVVLNGPDWVIRLAPVAATTPAATGDKSQ